MKEVRGAASAALPETHPRASVCLHRRAPGAFYHLLQSELTAAGAEQDGEEEGVLLLLGFFPQRERERETRRTGERSPPWRTRAPRRMRIYITSMQAGELELKKNFYQLFTHVIEARG